MSIVVRTCNVDENEFRIVGTQVETRLIGARLWRPVSRQYLLKFEVDSALWDWLRSHGLNRPSPSGNAPENERATIQVKLRLEPEVAALLEVLVAKYKTTKSELVSTWIRRELIHM